MDERELSKLAYLAVALVSKPANYRRLLGLLTDRWALRVLRKPSRELRAALSGLRRGFDVEFGSDAVGSARARLRRVIRRLDRGGSGPRAAGRALHWAVEIGV